MKFDYRSASMTMTATLSGVAAITAWVTLIMGEYAIAAIAGISLVVLLPLFVGILNGGDR